jgi:TIR domain/PDZ domain
MSGPSIFICHSSKDHKIAETICDALESRGFKCWIACRDVGPGENYQEAIVEALRSSRLMVLVFTSNANNSDEIKKEVSLAGRHHATIIPVRAEDVAPNDALTYEFATRQWIDLFGSWERGIERLTNQIRKNLTVIPTNDNHHEQIALQPLPPGHFIRWRWRYPLAISLILIAVALGIGSVYLFTPSAPPAPPLSPQAAEERAWLNAVSIGTTGATKQYLDRFPNGLHMADAQRNLRKADEGSWIDAAGIGTVDALKQYLSQFPEGAHAIQAETRIVELQRQVADDKAWSAALLLGTAAAFNQYVKASPSGAHVTEASARVSTLDAALCKARYPDALSRVPPPNSLTCKQEVAVLDETCGPAKIKKIIAGCTQQGISRMTFCVPCELGFGRLGVHTQKVTEDIAADMKLTQARGLLIIDVGENGAAKPAGLKPGDVVIMIDGKEIKEPADLPRVVTETPAGKTVNLVIIRNGKEETLPVMLGP